MRTDLEDPTSDKTNWAKIINTADEPIEIPSKSSIARFYPQHFQSTLLTMKDNEKPNENTQDEKELDAAFAETTHQSDRPTNKRNVH